MTLGQQVQDVMLTWGQLWEGVAVVRGRAESGKHPPSDGWAEDGLAVGDGGDGTQDLLLGGTLFHVFGLMMMSLGKEYYQFLLAQSICSGLGASAIFYSSTNSIATWFKKKRAMALGIASSGSACGGVVTP